MRIFFIGIFLAFSAVACHESIRSENSQRNFSTPRQKTVCYEVRQDGTLLGYADKYEWENNSGVKRQNYFVYSPTRELIGHIQWDGKTKKYAVSGETIRLGSHEFNVALQQLFEVDQVEFFPVGTDAPETTSQKS